MTQSEVDSLIQQLNELHIEKQRVLDRLVLARQRERAKNTTTPSTRRPFRVGDGVTITNAIAKNSDRQANQNDRDSVVTKVEGEKIHILTNNGFSTWLKLKNVRFA